MATSLSPLPSPGCVFSDQARLIIEAMERAALVSLQPRFEAILDDSRQIIEHPLSRARVRGLNHANRLWELGVACGRSGEAAAILDEAADACLQAVLCLDRDGARAAATAGGHGEAIAAASLDARASLLGREADDYGRVAARAVPEDAARSALWRDKDAEAGLLDDLCRVVGDCEPSLVREVLATAAELMGRGGEVGEILATPDGVLRQARRLVRHRQTQRRTDRALGDPFGARYATREKVDALTGQREPPARRPVRRGSLRETLTG